MLMGPSSTAEERATFADAIRADPRRYIAQPVLTLSRVPTLIDGEFAGRHVDCGHTSCVAAKPTCIQVG